jgi:hypothetical protein
MAKALTYLIPTSASNADLILTAINLTQQYNSKSDVDLVAGPSPNTDQISSRVGSSVLKSQHQNLA